MGKKNKDTSIEEELESIQNEARSGFSLRDRLAGRNNRRETVTVYTDAVAGDKLGYAFDQLIPQTEVKTGHRIRKGLAGELDAIQEEGERLSAHIAALEENDTEVPEEDTQRAAEIGTEIKRLKAEIAKVTKTLNDSSLVFTLHTLPDAILKDVRRKTKLSLGIKGKGIPEARKEEWEEEYTVQLLASSVESWEDKETGETHSALTVDQAKDLQGYLPVGQFQRLDSAMVKLSFEAAIGNVGTDSADF